MTARPRLVRKTAATHNARARAFSSEDRRQEEDHAPP